MPVLRSAYIPLRGRVSTPTSTELVIVVAPSVPPVSVTDAAEATAAPKLSNASGTSPGIAITTRVCDALLAGPMLAVIRLPVLPVYFDVIVTTVAAALATTI